jgi:hypothetical protein
MKRIKYISNEIEEKAVTLPILQSLRSSYSLGTDILWQSKRPIHIT